MGILGRRIVAFRDWRAPGVASNAAYFRMEFADPRQSKRMDTETGPARGASRRRKRRVIPIARVPCFWTNETAAEAAQARKAPINTPGGSLNPARRDYGVWILVPARVGSAFGFMALQRTSYRRKVSK